MSVSAFFSSILQLHPPGSVEIGTNFQPDYYVRPGGAQRSWHVAMVRWLLTNHEVDKSMGPVISNIVIACPDGHWIAPERRWEGIPRDLALFYAELLDMQILREDWLKIGWDLDGMHLAFGDGPTKNYLAPVWGDPERPPQVLLELPAADVGLAGDFARGIGANLLEEREGVRTYADPVGHPFRLYTDPADSGTAQRPLSGKIGRIVFQCFSPRALAPFWSELVNMPLRLEDSPDRVVVANPDRSLPMLGFEHAVVRAPRWPDPAYPQQIHLDLYFESAQRPLETAERLGAIRMPAMGGSCPVYSDPAGHPFCLCEPGQ